jgi:glycosyltransferase involved in cell wall biosynthesis
VENPLRVAMTLEQCWHKVPGGTAVAGVGMARALDARSDVDLIGVAARHSGPAPQAWAPPVPVAQMPLPRVLLYESWHRFRRPRVERATGRVDVIHATTFAIPPRSAPLIVTVHDLAFLNDPTHFTRRGLSFFKRGLRLARRDADLVICPSEATRRDCARIGLEDGRLRVVPMGVDARIAGEQEVIEARRKYGLDRPYLLWTGTIEPRKNLPRLISAFGSLDIDLDLVLVGPRGWNEDLDKFTQGGTRSDVKTLGFVPLEDLPPLYAGATVFCFPSLFEGFGLPVLEAMTQGTPVVTSRGTSTEELGRDAAVLVDPEDPSSIADGIRSVVEDESLAHKLAAAGSERASSYSWERTAELVSECYQEVVA